MHKHKNSMECFSEPSFLLLLKESQEVAASTDCHEDYELLAELLSYRTEQEYPRTAKAAIRRAIKIVDEIDSTALCGLTVYHSAITLFTTNGSLEKGLKHLDVMYSKLIHTCQATKELTLRGILLCRPTYIRAYLREGIG